MVYPVLPVPELPEPPPEPPPFPEPLPEPLPPKTPPRIPPKPPATSPRNFPTSLLELPGVLTVGEVPVLTLVSVPVLGLSTPAIGTAILSPVVLLYAQVLPSGGMTVVYALGIPSVTSGG